jgi:hypothetical protein
LKFFVVQSQINDKKKLQIIVTLQIVMI